MVVKHSHVNTKTFHLIFFFFLEICTTLVPQDIIPVFLKIFDLYNIWFVYTDIVNVTWVIKMSLLQVADMLVSF